MDKDARTLGHGRRWQDLTGVSQSEHPGVPRLFLHLEHAAELPASRKTGVPCTRPFCGLLFVPHRQMEGELVVEITLEAIAPRPSSPHEVR